MTKLATQKIEMTYAQALTMYLSGKDFGNLDKDHNYSAFAAIIKGLVELNDGKALLGPLMRPYYDRYVGPMLDLKLVSYAEDSTRLVLSPKAQAWYVAYLKDIDVKHPRMQSYLNWPWRAVGIPPLATKIPDFGIEEVEATA